MNRGKFIRNVFGAFAAVAVGKYIPLATRVPDLEATKRIGGYLKVSRQLLSNLPFLQQTLSELLLEDLKNI